MSLPWNGSFNLSLCAMPAEEINTTQMSPSKTRHSRQKWAEVIDKTFLNRLFIAAGWNGSGFSATASISKTFLSLAAAWHKKKAFYYPCLSNRLSAKQVLPAVACYWGPEREKACRLQLLSKMAWIGCDSVCIVDSFSLCALNMDLLYIQSTDWWGY